MKKWPLLSWVITLLLFSGSAPIQAKKLTDILEDILKTGEKVAPLVISSDELGHLFAQGVEKKYGLANDPQGLARLERIGNRLLAANDIKRKYHYGVLASHNFNAVSIYGGRLRVFQGLLSDTRNSDAELAAVIAHELAHNELGHNGKSVKLFKVTYAAELVNLTEKLPEVLSLAAQAALAKRSRKDEREADRWSLPALLRAGYNPRGMVAVMCRIEAEHRLEQERYRDNLVQQRFAQIFATHPQPASRVEMAEDFLFQTKYGSSFRAIAGEDIDCSPGNQSWEPETGLQMYERCTGRKVYHRGEENYFERGGLIGQCTWFVYAVRPPGQVAEIRPSGQNHAYLWWRNYQEDGFATGQEAKPGAIAVWDQSVGGGHGHVAMVAKVNQDGSFEVWDSNWSANLDERVRHRLVRPGSKGLVGFIYWKGSAEESRTQEETSQDRTLILKGPVHLGDDVPGSQIQEEATFDFDQTDATLKLRVRGSPQKDPIIWINRHEVARIVTQDNQWQWFEFPVRSQWLSSSRNLFHIRAWIPDRWQTFDDCEIADVWLFKK